MTTALQHTQAPAMDMGGFVVQGSRPPSVQTDRPRSARSRNGYHTIAYQSSVDETLFSSHHPGKVDEPVPNFKAPWEQPKPKPIGNTFAKVKTSAEKSKPKWKGRPLLWAPTPGAQLHTYTKKSISRNQDTNLGWNSRDHFQNLKHTPTFVDESLFGEKLEEPAFEAPWNVSGKRLAVSSGSKTKSFSWNSNGGGVSHTQPLKGVHLDLGNSKYISYERPKTSLGLSRGSDMGSKAVPVWKP